MELPSVPHRVAALGPTHRRAKLPSWLTRALRPQALVSTRAEVAWGVTLIGVSGLLIAADIVVPVLRSSALLFLPVLAASWMLSKRLFLVVLLLALTAQAALALVGEMHPAAAAAKALTIALVGGVGRLAATSWAAMRRARQHEFGTLIQTSHRLGQSLDQHGVASEAVRLAVGTVAHAPGRVAILAKLAVDRLTVVAGSDESGAPVLPGIELPLAEMPPAFQETVWSGRPNVVHIGELTPALRGLVAPFGAEAWAMARVVVAGEPFGILAVAVREAGFGRDDLRLLDGIARVAGLAIRAALRHAELAELKQRLQNSVELALEVGRTLDPAEVVDSILVRMAESVQAERGTLARVDAGALVLESSFSSGQRQLTPVRRRFAPEAAEAIPVLARALASGQPVLGGPLEAGVGGEDLLSALGNGPHTLTFPFLVFGPTSCLLVLSRQDRPFDETDLANLEPMADVALLALRNANLYTQAEQAMRAASSYSGRLRLAIEAAEDIGSSEELGDVVERLLRRAVEAVHADNGCISRLDGETLVVEHDFDTGGRHLATGLRWRLSECAIASEALRARRPMRGTRRDMSPGAETERWLDAAGVRTMIQCPLTVEREVVGVLGLSRRSDVEFTESDLLTLQPFAALAGLLLRNARLLADARQVGEAKSAFLNLAAHELRTPLAVIKGYLSLLEDGTYPVPENTRREAVHTLVVKAQELESLVDSLLTTAGLEVGSLPRTLVDLDVREAVRQAIERIAPRARLEEAMIAMQLPDRAVMARFDRGHVARILDNLLNNALTYSPRPAHVMVEVRPGGPVEIAVVDRGRGIPPEEQERVFERFHRLDGPKSNFSPGLGLGLSLSRELAHINGGALVLERSVPGEGSVFVLRLAPVTARTAAPPRARAAGE